MVVDTQNAHAPQLGQCGDCRVIGAGRVASRTVNQKVLPCPGVLSTPIVPPIIVASRCEMASPSPVPPYFRVVEPSACENAWKRRPWTSGGMPMPVSVTANAEQHGVSVLFDQRGAHHTSPCSVNLMALPTRLVRIWRRRPGSPATQVGTSAWSMHASSSPLLAARSASKFEHVLDGCTQVEVNHLQVQLARFDLGEIQDVVNDGQERLPGLADGLGILVLCGRQRRV